MDAVTEIPAAASCSLIESTASESEPSAMFIFTDILMPAEFRASALVIVNLKVLSSTSLLDSTSLEPVSVLKV